MGIEEVAEYFDALVNTDVGGRGAMRKLYPAARRLAKEPLTLSAARLIDGRVTAKSVVLIGTGFPIAPALMPETDGPIGAAALARALAYMLDAVPVVVTEEVAFPMVISACRAFELNVMGVKEARKARYAVSVLPLSLDEKKAKEESKALVEELDPSCLIVIEKVGRNVKGIYHNAGGGDISANSAKMDELVREAERKKVLTIGIGDGGNEIGMGALAEEVRRSIPYGAKCRCPCDGGIACVTKTDLLVTACISNWGGYGIEAALGALKGKVELIHDGKIEKRGIHACVASGAVDGNSGSPVPSVDGLSDEINAAFADILRTTAIKGMKK